MIGDWSIGVEAKRGRAEGGRGSVTQRNGEEWWLESTTPSRPEKPGYERNWKDVSATQYCQTNDAACAQFFLLGLTADSTLFRSKREASVRLATTRRCAPADLGRDDSAINLA